jgi:type II secretory pathway pseudopilin PulG
MIKEPVIKDKEHSFTILEVMVAIGIMMSVVMEVVGAQGNVVAFSSYSRQVTQATWLAKQVMSQVEYHQQTHDFKELETSIKDQQFDIEGLNEDESEFTYTLEIEEWKLPIFELISNGGLQKKKGDDDDDAEPGTLENQGLMSGFQGVVNQLFDGHIFKIATVEVFWPEGARRNSVSLTYLMSNQKALDQYISSKKEVFEKLSKSIKEMLEGKKGKKSTKKPSDKDP